MTQILRIFCKDVRHLTPFILALLGLQAAFAIGVVRSVGHVDSMGALEPTLGLSEALLPLAWIFLVALAVQQESPVGENSFWLTRPYSRLSVLLSKTLFAVVFLNLPLLLSDCYILQAVGLPLDFGHLVLRQLPLTALVIVPAFALASISKNVSQFSLFLVGVILAMVVELMTSANLLRGSQPWPDAFPLIFFPSFALLAIVIQFARRITVNRIWLGVLVALYIPVTFMTTHLLEDGAFSFARQTTWKDTKDWSQIQLHLATPKQRASTGDVDTRASGILIPLSVQGLPTGVALGGYGETRIGPEGKPLFSLLAQSADGYAIEIGSIDKSLASETAVPVQAAMDIWLLNDKVTTTTALSSKRLVSVPEVGACSLSPASQTITCWHGPLRPAAVNVKVGNVETLFPYTGRRWASDQRDGGYEELIWDFSPLERRKRKVGSAISNSETVSFAPRVSRASFRVLLDSPAYPIKDCPSEFELKAGLLINH